MVSDLFNSFHSQRPSYGVNSCKIRVEHGREILIPLCPDRFRNVYPWWNGQRIDGSVQNTSLILVDGDQR